MSLRGLLSVVLLLISVRETDASSPLKYEWPTTQWKTALPSQVGIDQSEFERFLSYTFPDSIDWASRDGVRTEGLVIVKDGLLVYERYDKGFGPDRRHLAWSMTKLVTNALVGIAERRGLFSRHDSVAKLLPKEAARVGNLRVEDLLAWSSGLDWRETYEYNPLRSSVIAMLYAEGSKAVADFVLSHGFREAPGRRFNYSSGDSNLLQAVLKSTLGDRQYAEFPWGELFNKIGMRSAVLERDRSEVFVGSSYLHTTARDLAKLGLLYLNDGVWNGERILPQGWVFWSNQIVPAYHQSSSDIRYEKLTPGYHVWLNRTDAARGIQKVLPDVPEDTFAASGHWGQSMWMIPSQRLIVVRFADDRDRSFSANRFLRLLLNSLSNPLSAERNRQ